MRNGMEMPCFRNELKFQIILFTIKNYRVVETGVENENL